MSQKLLFKRLSDNAKAPYRATEDSAGYDISSSIHMTISPKSQGVVSTGLAIRVPNGTYGRIAPRSGLALRHCIDVLAGVIDRDYTSEVKVILYNHSNDVFVITIGDRIAQLILEQIQTPDIEEVNELSITERNGGFGSTGKN